MALRIITAEERLAEIRMIKAAIFGGSGQGKTSLLWTLLASTTLFFDLEAGDLAVEGWPGDTIRPRTWQECRDFAAFIGGPNPALRDDQPYSAAHHAAAPAAHPATTTEHPAATAADSSWLWTRNAGGHECARSHGTWRAASGGIRDAFLDR